VIDMICFSVDSARHLVESAWEIQHPLYCGTIWVHIEVQAPIDWTQPRRPFGEYGIQKAAIEAYLLEQARRTGFPATVLHPGHIVGPGWNPINPAGHLNPQVFEVLARGEELLLPNLGMETLHHVHADDVAQGFMQALTNFSSAVGESFHIVSRP
jgi:nucleoside-diphosphate-sugar epimerase